MTLHTIEEPAAPVSHPLWRARHPLWALGFRPFYLLAALVAMLAVPAWLGRYLGWFSGAPAITLGWHMHEMVFGFAVAVVVGFLFTAGRAWTGLWTPRGLHLASLALLFVAGRVAMLSAPAPLAALVDGLFLPLAAWSMFRVLQRAGNKRNMFLVGLLALLSAANLAYHAAAMDVLAISIIAPIHAGILLIVLIEAVIGGRVIPMFTDNGAPGTPKAVASPRADQLALGLLAAGALAWIAALPGALTAALLLAAAAASALRLARWKPLRARGIPLLWILHLSYAWISIGLLLLAAAAIGLVSASTAFHALAVGSMAGLIVGMMTRTSLGHTGRRLLAGPAETAMYVLIQAGAVLRVAAGLIVPARDSLLVLSALAWSLSFLLFLWVYLPYLWQPRLDGKEG